MVICDPDLMRLAFDPFEDHPPLVVDSDRVKSLENADNAEYIWVGRSRLMSKTKKSERKRRIVRSKSDQFAIVRNRGTVRVEALKTEDGHEAWRIQTGDRVVDLVTSTSSTSAMDDAVRIYLPALERLAKR
jgi:hypothetical protein